eukprot:6181031-Pleurochrysis_carterae.AAC.4
MRRGIGEINFQGIRECCALAWDGPRRKTKRRARETNHRLVTPRGEGKVRLIERAVHGFA